MASVDEIDCGRVWRKKMRKGEEKEDLPTGTWVRVTPSIWSIYMLFFFFGLFIIVFSLSLLFP